MKHLRAREVSGDHNPISTTTDIEPTEAIARLCRRPDDTDEAFSRRAVDTLHRSLAYSHEADLAREHRWHIPPRENLILWLGGLFFGRMRKYTFCDHEKAVWRGVGLCGQQARALTSALRAGDIDASPVAFDGHVVVRAVISGDEWILDSDLNTIIPYSLEECQTTPEIVRPYYAEAETIDRRVMNKKYLDELVEIFGSEFGTLTPPYNIHQCVETDSYIFQQLLPL